MRYLRRLYLYVMAFLAMEASLWGLIILGNSLIGPEDQAGMTALGLSMSLVGLPVFLLHWIVVQRSADADMGDRTARLRALFLYGGLLATLIPAVQTALAVISRALTTAFAGSAAQSMFGGAGPIPENLVTILLNSLLAFYLYSVLRSDWSEAPGEAAYRKGQRLERYFWSLYSLALVFFGLQRILNFALAAAAPGAQADDIFFVDGLSLLIVGIPLAVYVWGGMRTAWAEAPEKGSLSRFVFLYALVFLGAAGALAASGLILERLLALGLGGDQAMAEMAGQIAASLSWLVPLAGIWTLYRRLLREQAALVGEVARRDRLERVYVYGLALLGLVGVVVGLDMLLSRALDIAFKDGASTVAASSAEFAAPLASLAISMPLWVLSWRAASREAAVMGEEVRRSPVRRFYFNLVMFIGILGMILGAGGLLFILVSASLGYPGDDLLLQAVQWFQTTLLFGIVLIYHWPILRTDRRFDQRALARLYAQYPVLVLVPEEGEFAEVVVDALAREAPDMPVAVHLSEQGAPDGTLSAARAVILPSELTARPSEAVRLWLQGFDGVRFVIPADVTGWRWILGERISLAASARRAAHLVRRLAEGEEL